MSLLYTTIQIVKSSNLEQKSLFDHEAIWTLNLQEIRKPKSLESDALPLRHAAGQLWKKKNLYL